MKQPVYFFLLFASLGVLGTVAINPDLLDRLAVKVGLSKGSEGDATEYRVIDESEFAELRRPVDAAQEEDVKKAKAEAPKAKIPDSQTPKADVPADKSPKDLAKKSEMKDGKEDVKPKPLDTAKITEDAEELPYAMLTPPFSETPEKKKDAKPSGEESEKIVQAAYSANPEDTGNSEIRQVGNNGQVVYPGQVPSAPAEPVRVVSVIPVVSMDGQLEEGAGFARSSQVRTPPPASPEISHAIPQAAPPRVPHTVSTPPQAVPDYQHHFQEPAAGYQNQSQGISADYRNIPNNGPANYQNLPQGAPADYHNVQPNVHQNLYQEPAIEYRDSSPEPVHGTQTHGIQPVVQPHVTATVPATVPVPIPMQAPAPAAISTPIPALSPSGPPPVHAPLAHSPVPVAAEVPSPPPSWDLSPAPQENSPFTPLSQGPPVASTENLWALPSHEPPGRMVPLSDIPVSSNAPGAALSMPPPEDFSAVSPAPPIPTDPMQTASAASPLDLPPSPFGAQDSSTALPVFPVETTPPMSVPPSPAAPSPATAMVASPWDMPAVLPENSSLPPLVPGIEPVAETPFALNTSLPPLVPGIEPVAETPFALNTSLPPLVPGIEPVAETPFALNTSLPPLVPGIEPIVDTPETSPFSTAEMTPKIAASPAHLAFPGTSSAWAPGEVRPETFLSGVGTSDASGIPGTPEGSASVPPSLQMPITPSLVAETIPCHGADIVARVGANTILLCDILPQARRRVMANYRENYEKEDELGKAHLERIREEYIQQGLMQVYPMILNEEIQYALLYNDFVSQKLNEEVAMITKQFSDSFDIEELPKLYEEFEAENTVDLKRCLKEEYGSDLDRERIVYTRRNIAYQWGGAVIRMTGEADCSLDEMREYYDNNKKEFEHPAKARWEHLYVAKAGHPSEKAAYNKLAEMGNLIATKRMPFDEVARSRSESPTASNGGQWDWMGRGVLVAEELEKAVFEGPVGVLSPIIETRDGFHIIRVVEREDLRHTPFTEAQITIRKKLDMQRRMKNEQEYVESLRKRFPVQILRENPMM